MHQSSSDIKSAPRGFLPTFLTLGPGIVLTGGVIGSGELITTPIQAATFGFVLLWAVILSCVIKYFLQIEIARHCLVHNRSPFEAMNLIPGPKLFNTSWIIFVFMLAWTVASIGGAGIVGSMAGVLQRMMPLNQWLNGLPGFGELESVRVWAVVVVVVTWLLLAKGVYSHLEKTILVLVIGFSTSMVAALVMLQGTEYRITSADIVSGLRFSLGEAPADWEIESAVAGAETDNQPSASLSAPERRQKWEQLAAVAVITLMGGLGVSGVELLLYPHWVREKGYPRFLGPPDSDGWLPRAQGWLRILKIDAAVATLLATLITTAFFLLGCAVLFRLGHNPEGIGVVDAISATFTNVYGGWSRGIFLFGAMCTLLSTLLAAPATNGRYFTDLFCSLGFVDRDRPEQVRRSTQVMQFVYLFAIVVLYFFMTSEPKALVLLSHYVIGLAGTPVAVVAICWIAFQTDRRLRMKPLTATVFVLTVVIILACVGIGFAVKSGWIVLGVG